MQFVYFNTDSNKFNFLAGNGSLEISDGKPVIKTNNAEMQYIDATEYFVKHTISLNSNNRYIIHINFNAINKDICFIDDITLEEALNKYNIEIVNSKGDVLNKYLLCDSVNPIVSFKSTLYVENTDSITIQTNYKDLQIYEHGSSVVVETI